MEIALSTMEAEYIALPQSMRDFLPMKVKVREVLAQLKVVMTAVVTHSIAFEDNGALMSATTKKMTPRSKNIGIKYHYFREAVTDGAAKIKNVDSDTQKADIFTKGLGIVKIQGLGCLLDGW